MLVTVFTPTYNRAYRLESLYKSLCNQTNDDFEWLIVDDGSTDNTTALVRGWQNEGRVDIRYIYQENGGKHRAINQGLREAKGKYFFIVDSDDYLTTDAIEWIKTTYSEIDNDNSFAGISGVRVYNDGTKVGGGDDFGVIDADALEIRLKYHVKGDMAEIYKTEILRQFPFPEFDNEKFCPEALVWNRIAVQHKLRYVHKGIYVCEYLNDGLTSKIIRIRRNSPLASMMYYSELFHANIALIWKFKAGINFWRFALAPYDYSYKMLNLISILCWLPGHAMRFLDQRK